MITSSILKNIIVAMVALLLPLSLFAVDLNKERQFEKAPGHSKSDLPCETCHMQNHPELKPKLKRVSNKLYKAECGSCHLAYQPELLPKRSWKKMMEELDNHFGEELELHPKKHYRISRYLFKLSADKSKAVRAKGIMASLGADKAPQRISQTGYIKDLHKKVGAEVFARESIRSIANCSACHISADGAMYYQKHIVVPK